MLSDFSTLTDLRELFASISSEMDFSLRDSGVRERLREDDEDDDFDKMGAISLLRLERDLLLLWLTGGGDGELRLLRERGERARCDFLLRSRDLERLPLPLLPPPPPPTPPPPAPPWERERRLLRDVLRRWRDLERLPRDREERECFPPRERERREREVLRR